MTELQILAVKPKSLSLKSIRQLEKSGVIVLETDTPNDVRLVTPQPTMMTPNDLLAAMARAVEKSSDYTKTLVANEFCAAIQAAYERTT